MLVVSSLEMQCKYKANWATQPFIKCIMQMACWDMVSSLRWGISIKQTGIKHSNQWFRQIGSRDNVQHCDSAKLQVNSSQERCSQHLCCIPCTPGWHPWHSCSMLLAGPGPENALPCCCSCQGHLLSTALLLQSLHTQGPQAETLMQHS